MRQFDVYLNPSVRTRGPVPYVVVLQSHFLDATPTVIVAPMPREEVRVPYSKSSAAVTFDNQTFFVSVAELVAIERRLLTQVRGNLLAFDYEIRRAIDQVFLGF